ncbi:MAG: ATP-dependent RecD-like DNA helicase [Anaerolineales bacterium]|nr:ATP-dependent RecD-like DNA helicase [Chloroflexota bacterium]MBL6981500.1 ATP-dependent RecD-like DNA helicase [Anaerolineales bacterium]
MESLSGSVERVTYYNAENGYSVVRLRPAKRVSSSSRDGLVTIVGNLPELSPGEHLKLDGRWTKHPKHGSQFSVEKCEQTLPATVVGIQRYLGSGLIKGIGSKLAERIVDHFGDSTLEIIEDQPQRLLEVPDIGAKRSQTIVIAWQEQKQVKEIMLFLHSHGVSTNLAVKIYKTYGDSALGIVQENPYQLARDIYGVGFKTADRIAQDLGLPSDHPSRIEAGVIYALNEMSSDGHVYAPKEYLIARATELLKTNAELIPPALNRLAGADFIRSEMIPTEERRKGDSTSRLVAEPNGEYRSPAIYLAPFYFGEVGVADRLRILAKATPVEGRYKNLPIPNPELSKEQQIAINNALMHPLSILTGGPGTGKTTCLKSLIFHLESSSIPYALASPTGRAAKRLSESTGRPASTIHRLLGFSPKDGFKYNNENPLPVEFLVVDETSMLDLLLANNLFKSLRPGTHVLLVGDVDQLPSVGAGDVLRDVIASDSAPVTRLTTIFRQAAGSNIITNAHRINCGDMPQFSQTGSSEIEDFFLFPAEEALSAGDWIEDVVCNRIPQKFGFDPINQIQVLAPMYRGPAGVTALNQRLQEVLNPPSARKPDKNLFGQIFRPGDKVMQTRNDYDKDVYNGDIGSVRALDIVEHTLTVDFEGRLVSYDWSETDQLNLAYAVSVHKAQGSEFPVIVMPVVTQHYIMLQRNLLYTAITRAQKLCVLVGNRRAIGIAVNNNKVAQRFTALDWRLREG